MQEGLGKLDSHALEASGGGAQSLLNAQAAAKAGKAGVWSVGPTDDEIKVSYDMYVRNCPFVFLFVLEGCLSACLVFLSVGSCTLKRPNDKKKMRVLPAVSYRYFIL